jgi:glutamine cyclotransferase
MKLITLSFLIALTGFAACSSKTSTQRKPVTNIQISPANRTIIHGNEFTVKLQSRYTKPEIESIELYLNDSLLTTSNKADFDYTINTKALLPGQYSLRTVAQNSKNQSGTNVSKISIVSGTPAQRLSYTVKGTLDHNTANYTQGFEFYNNNLYEGTGNYAESQLFAYQMPYMKVLRTHQLDDRYFGEGITILNDKLYQLTYKAQKGFVYNAETFEPTGEFGFQSKEGWGLTNNGTHLIMSDGTSKITYIDPQSFKIVKTIEVSHPGGFVNHLNELEYVDGVIYANIWPGETIVKFDAQNGNVIAFIDMRGLLSNFNTGRIDALNGIAWHKTEQVFYVTGKWWPKIFKVSFN